MDNEYRECKGFGNLIEHGSDRDGTKRSAKACYIIKNFNPQSGVELAKVVLANRNSQVKSIYHIQLPMFFNDKQLVNYCKADTKQYPEFFNDCVSHIDTIDLPADSQRLSPILNKKYPGDDWHKLVREFETALHKEGVY